VTLQKEETAYFHCRHPEASHNFAATGVTTPRETKERGFEILKGKRNGKTTKYFLKKRLNLQHSLSGREKEFLFRHIHEISGFNPVLGKGSKYLRRKITQNRRIPN
jgi:hypothetical protein